MNKGPQYPIKSVSRLTGLSTHLIRAWERRYGVVQPVRTETNRRLYSDEDVSKLRLLSKAISMGLSIGSIAGFSAEKIKSIVNAPLTAMDVLQGQSDFHSAYLDGSMDAIMNYQQDRLRNTLLKASIDLSQKELISSLIIPLINYIGNSWQKGSLRIAQEHMASSEIVNFLQYMRGMYKNAEGSPRLISATLQGELHELGALIVSSIAASEGWKVTYLGPNLPVDELISTAVKTSAKVICLSLVFPGHDQQIAHDLKLLDSLIGNRTEIIIGGRAARLYIDVIRSTKILLIEDINEFRNKLNEFQVQIDTVKTTDRKKPWHL